MMRCALLVGSIVALTILAGCDRGGADVPQTDASDQANSKADAMPADRTTDDTGFNGTFHGTVNGVQSVVKMNNRDGQISGHLDVAPFTARATGNAATGDIKDPDSGIIVGTIDLALQGQSLTVNLVLKDPQTGETLTVPPMAYGRGEPPPINVQTDPALIGHWRYTWTAASGGASMAVDNWLYIEADGTFSDGPSTAAGGDANVGMESSTEGGSFRGKWRTEDRTMYVMEHGTTQWVPLARYYVEGDTMMFTYDNGNKRIYERP